MELYNGIHHLFGKMTNPSSNRMVFLHVPSPPLQNMTGYEEK